jgi:hypothetical protein
MLWRRSDRHRVGGYEDENDWGMIASRRTSRGELDFPSNKQVIPADLNTSTSGGASSTCAANKGDRSNDIRKVPSNIPEHSIPDRSNIRVDIEGHNTKDQKQPPKLAPAIRPQRKILRRERQPEQGRTFS